MNAPPMYLQDASAPDHEMMKVGEQGINSINFLGYLDPHRKFHHSFRTGQI